MLTRPAPTTAVTPSLAPPVAAEETQPQDMTPPRVHRRAAFSMRVRLTLWNLAILICTLLLFGVSLYAFLAWSLDKEITDSLPQQYNQIRDSTIFVRSPFEPELRTNLDPNTFASEDLDVYVQIARLDGEVPAGGRSANLGDIELPLSPEVLAAVREGNTIAEREVVVNGHRMRLYSGPLYFRAERGPLIIGLVQVARSLAPMETTLTQLRFLLIGGGAFSIIVAAVASFLLAGAALRPLDRLAQAARCIGISRDFSRRVEHTGPGDEIGQLSHTFNEMLGQLQAAHNNLATALEAQRRFVADASHELRTPLTTIRGNVGLLRRVSEVTPEDRVAALADIESEAERMARLVGQMLSLARADAGQALRLQPVDLDVVVLEVGRQMALLASERGLVATTGRVEPARVNGDHDALKQLLLILIDNAIKYTPAPGSVRLSLTLADGWAIVEVEDTGIGIGEKELPHIFERFYRADPARSGGGAGLGLAIAKWIAWSHQGSIAVHSEPGRGSVFTTRLPLCVMMPRAIESP